MSLSHDQVRHVAMLARLGLDDEERERLGRDLSDILGHVSELQKIDTSAVPETAQVGDLVNVWRDDVPATSLPADEALADAPDREGPYFRVGAIQELG
jgi:aspartyl-tRNA(Asn)/glutamyl-tRNA(Gln) amidotransferase subunit C